MQSSQSPVGSHLVIAAISCFIFIVAMWQFLPTIAEREFHRDEARNAVIDWLPERT